MDKPRSIVLLSGGMDSVTALYIAGQHTDVVAVMFFDYGQRGMRHERKCVRTVGAMTKSWGHDKRAALPQFVDVSIKMPVTSGLLAAVAPCPGPDELDDHGQPATFVPARNLIFLSYAAAVAYDLEATHVYGGWNEIDVDYPDCRHEFIEAAERAMNEALGHPSTDPVVLIRAPLLRRTKAEVVLIGTGLEVPWELTRSCYESEASPCLRCDSCMKRISAFLTAGQRDPTVTDDGRWEWATEQYRQWYMRKHRVGGRR